MNLDTTFALNKHSERVSELQKPGGIMDYSLEYWTGYSGSMPGPQKEGNGREVAPCHLGCGAFQGKHKPKARTRRCTNEHGSHRLTRRRILLYFQLDICRVVAVVDIRFITCTYKKRLNVETDIHLYWHGVVC